MPRICEIKEKEYLDKKFEAAKEIIGVMLSQHPPEYTIDARKRGSLIFNTCAIADDLLQELGYRVAGKKVSKNPNEMTAMRKLEDILVEDKKRK